MSPQPMPAWRREMARFEIEKAKVYRAEGRFDRASAALRRAKFYRNKRA